MMYQVEDIMKMKMHLVGFALLTMFVGEAYVHAARKPSKVGQASMSKKEQEQEKFQQLLTEIAGANIAQVKILLEDDVIKKQINEHDGVFSPLGKVEDELEKNKRSSLAKTEKAARAKALHKIKKLLQECGATVIFRAVDVSGSTKKRGKQMDGCMLQSS